MEEIGLKELFLIIGKKIWLIVLITVLFLVTSGIISYFILEPQYQAFTTLMVGRPKDYGNNKEVQYEDILLNQKLVSTYGEVAKSRVVSNEVIENLDLKITYEKIKDKVEVSLVENTEIIKINATDKDPRLATDIANEVAKVFIEHVSNIMKIENVQVIDEALEPSKQIRPRPILNMAIGGILGFMLSALIILLLEYLDNTLKNPEDINKYLDLPVIGIIPECK